MKEKRTISDGVANPISITNPSVTPRTLCASKAQLLRQNKLIRVAGATSTAATRRSAILRVEKTL
ncbi:MAG: hypothetical protein ABI865_07425 [Nitrosospira sp.]